MQSIAMVIGLAFIVTSGCGTDMLQSRQDVQERPDAGSSPKPAAVGGSNASTSPDAATAPPAPATGHATGRDAAVPPQPAPDAAQSAAPASGRDASAAHDDDAGASLTQAAADWPDTGWDTLRTTPFPSGSDVLTLSFDSFDLTTVSGHIMFGMGPAADPPDPHSALMTFNQQPVFEAYNYVVRAALFDGERLRFDVVSNEIWQSYCASFPPIADEVNQGQFACLPNWPYTRKNSDEPTGCYLTNPKTRLNERFDCAQYVFCNEVLGVCKCDDKACKADDSFGIHFDMIVAPDRQHINGSVSGLAGVLNVHFKPE